MSSILLLGSSGLIGKAITAAAPGHWSIAKPSSKDCDITNAEAVDAAFASTTPALVINAAGFTQVDAAEDHDDLAQRTNALGPELLAAACAKSNARLIHVSSDYVFDGNATTPYNEDAPTHPISRYGKTKLGGEQAVLASRSSALVIRTQWVFGEGAHSLVSSMRERAKRGEPSRVVTDQHGRPTYAMDLAAFIVALAERTDVTGVLHMANDGEATPYEIAATVYKHFGREGLVQPVSSAEFAARAKRPAYSVLALDRLRSLRVRPRHWREALAVYLDNA